MSKKWMDTLAGDDFIIIKADVYNPILQIKMRVYNHKKYIVQAIESILMQKTEYVYEIVIEDDCSTDGSWDIILEYQHRYPNVITAMHWNYNTYKLRFSGVLMSRYLKAKYLSYLEGDDYWTDPYKIQKQVSFLEMKPKFIGTTGNIRIINEDGTKQHRDYLLYPYQESHICDKQYIRNYQIISHISAMTHRNLYLEWSTEKISYYTSNKANGDDKICAILGLCGKVYYSSEIYSDHRRVFKGDSWTSSFNQKSDDEKRILLLELEKDLIELAKVFLGEEIKLKKRYESEKGFYNSTVLDMWMKTKQNNMSISSFLKKKGIKSIAIYGMAILGIRLFNELKGTDTLVQYAIDRDKTIAIPGIKVIHSLDEMRENPDAVIVTAFMAFDQIKKKLENVGCSNVIGLDEIMYEMCGEIQDENMICKML